jgi:hypothetical protein
LIISWANQFNQWCGFNSIIWADATLQVDGKQDLWWQFVQAESEFNQHWREIIQNSSMLVADEAMVTWFPHVSKTRGLPVTNILMSMLVYVLHFFYFIGTEFKDIACVVLGIIVCLEIQ